MLITSNQKNAFEITEYAHAPYISLVLLKKIT